MKAASKRKAAAAAAAEDGIKTPKKPRQTKKQKQQQLARISPPTPESTPGLDSPISPKDQTQDEKYILFQEKRAAREYSREEMRKVFEFVTNRSVGWKALPRDLKMEYRKGNEWEKEVKSKIEKLLEGYKTVEEIENLENIGDGVCADADKVEA